MEPIKPRSLEEINQELSEPVDENTHFYTIAVISQGVVYAVLGLVESAAAALLGEHKVIQLSDDPDGRPSLYWTYNQDTEEFIEPDTTNYGTPNSPEDSVNNEGQVDDSVVELLPVATEELTE